MQAAASVRRGATAWAESQFHSSAAVLSKSTVIPTRTRTLPRCSLNNLSTICLFFQTYLQFSTPSLQSLLAIPSHQCVSCSLPDNQFAGIHGSVMLTCAIVFLQKKKCNCVHEPRLWVAIFLLRWELVRYHAPSCSIVRVLHFSRWNF